MSKMTFTSPRATLEETLAFANAVREAGGANPLDALMPAVPQDPKQCLIARNLNFNCEVRGLPDRDYYGNYIPNQRITWGMFFGSDKELRDKIAAALELKTVDSWDGSAWEHRTPSYAMVLPKEIGRVAEEFDKWSHAIAYSGTDGLFVTTPYSEIERLRIFAPYVEASIREAKANGLLNEKGELIL